MYIKNIIYIYLYEYIVYVCLLLNLDWVRLFMPPVVAHEAQKHRRIGPTSSKNMYQESELHLTNVFWNNSATSNCQMLSKTIKLNWHTHTT